MNLKDKVAQLFCEISEDECIAKDLNEKLKNYADFILLTSIMEDIDSKKKEVDSMLREYEEDFSYEGNGYLAKKHTGSRKSIDWKIEQIEKTVLEVKEMLSEKKKSG